MPHQKREEERTSDLLRNGICVSAYATSGEREREGERKREREKERESKPASGRIQGQQNRADRLQDLARRGAGGRRWPPAPCRAAGATRREGGGREGATVSWPRRRVAPVGTVASRPLLLREGRREKQGEWRRYFTFYRIKKGSWTFEPASNGLKWICYRGLPS